VTSPFGQSLAVRGAMPAGTEVHMPGDPGALHVLQGPAQLALQQSPPTQKPLLQSPSHAHACPFGLCAAFVPLQIAVVGTSCPPSLLCCTPTGLDPQLAATATPRHIRKRSL
jgi:hypothetical protein